MDLELDEIQQYILKSEQLLIAHRDRELLEWKQRQNAHQNVGYELDNAFLDKEEDLLRQYLKEVRALSSAPVTANTRSCPSAEVRNMVEERNANEYALAGKLIEQYKNAAKDTVKQWESQFSRSLHVKAAAQRRKDKDAVTSDAYNASG